MLLALSSILGPAGFWLPYEWLFLNHLLSTDNKSFMHCNVINFVIITQCVSFFYLNFPCDVKYRAHAPPHFLDKKCSLDFVVTMSINGHLKLWKQDMGIKFVKHCHVHILPIISISISEDGQLFNLQASELLRIRALRCLMSSTLVCQESC